MNRQTHKELIEIYLSSGGDVKKIQLYKSFSPANHAKLKYFLKQIKIDLPDAKPVKIGAKTTTIIPEAKDRKGIWNDLISQYPIELHQDYQNRYKYWLEACSLKVELNAVHRKDEKTAYELQEKIMFCFEKMDKAQKALQHYQNHKRIIKTETKTDFSQLSPMELLLKRNSTRSNISKRNSTIARMEAILPNVSDPNFKRKLHSLNRKKEQLQELLNELEILEAMVGN